MWVAKLKISSRMSTQTTQDQTQHCIKNRVTNNLKDIFKPNFNKIKIKKNQQKTMQLHVFLELSLEHLDNNARSLSTIVISVFRNK